MNWKGCESLKMLRIFKKKVDIARYLGYNLKKHLTLLAIHDIIVIVIGKVATLEK